MTSHGADGELLDTLLVASDAELVDTLAARAQLRPTDDDVALLLAALAADVDEGLTQLLGGPALGSDREAATADDLAQVLPLRRGPGRTVRTVAAAVAAASILSVSGVAAAVTGDPLAPYRRVISAVGGDDELPPTAAPVARANKKLAGVGALVAHGDFAVAAAKLADVRASLVGLGPHDRRVVEKRLAALEARLARAKERSAGVAKPDKDEGAPKSGPGSLPTTGASQGEADQPKSKPSSGSEKDAKKPKPRATEGRDKESSPGHGAEADKAAAAQEVKVSVPDTKHGAANGDEDD